MVNILEKIKRFFKRSPKLSKVELEDIKVSEREIREGKCKTFNTAEEFISDLHKERDKWLNETRKEFKEARIAQNNLKRQKSTMGYGLKSRNFKPRPAFEKHLWNIQKKPEDD